MYRISKTFTFDAAHSLPEMPDGHQCRKLHGHTYSVTLTLQDERLNEYGVVVDYQDLSEFRDWIKARCDHQWLNETICPQPTAEHLARILYDAAAAMWPGLAHSVTVSETPATSATYEG